MLRIVIFFLVVWGVAIYAQRVSRADTITFEVVEEYQVTKPGNVYTGFYGGKSNRHANVGASFGYRFGDNFASEMTYDYVTGGNHFLFGNILAGLKFDKISPYAIAGLGYRWADNHEPVWNAGIGVNFAISENVSTDTRYRYINNFSHSNEDQIFSIGLVYNW